MFTLSTSLMRWKEMISDRSTSVHNSSSSSMTMRQPLKVGCAVMHGLVVCMKYVAGAEPQASDVKMM